MIADRDGILWVAGNSSDGGVVQRIGRKGVLQELHNVRPAGLLADEAGNVWLCDTRNPVQDDFCICRGRKCCNG